ncbi:MAG: bifunctional YncE family protein/alkaline phosphatase family protein [Candidatus Eremiobacter antarcticus]|nr:bifunctional YncE family protein/alkaline phosphatase family protein [Candidatus Eremiobacteraeota bacterium]
MRAARSVRPALFTLVGLIVMTAAGAPAMLPDGRSVTPSGFTIPVENFASSELLSPDRSRLAVLSQAGGAIDVITIGEHAMMSDRLSVPFASGMAWTKDGLYVTRGYSGAISRFAYHADSKGGATFAARQDLQVGGLLNGIAEDPKTHRIVVARTANQDVEVLDERTGSVRARLAASGQPFGVGFAGNGVFTTLYNSDHIDVWPTGAGSARHVATGPHPTKFLIDGRRLFVANADGHDVCEIDTNSWKVVRRFDLGVSFHQPPGQTPSSMAISQDRKQLFVAESGFNDVAVVDLANGRSIARIPTAWYPMDVIYLAAPTIDDDPRIKPQLFVLSAQGLGQQPDPGSEHDGTYTGIVQHLIVEPRRFASWSATVARNDHFNVPPPPPAAALPPIKHFVFIVKENKQFDEVFGDEPRADSDPTLLLYGRKYTPNAHALAERYTLMDNYMGDGDRSDFAHSWTTQGWANDYLERNVYSPDDLANKSDPRVPGSIWPIYLYGEDAIPVATMDFDWFQNLSALPRQPRANVSGVFGPHGELIDELSQRHISFRVYGEQMTMQPDGRIAPGLSSHAARNYPGAHIDFNVLDTHRARLFLEDVRAHGLAQYSYLTLPTDHTSGTDPGFYTMGSYVSNNDLALGQIIAGLSKRPEWRSTVVFVTTDDPQGTGDHVDSHRQPAFIIGPYVRHGYIDHTRYSHPSVLRTVEVLFGLKPLNIYDAMATPMLSSFARQPSISQYQAIASNVGMTRNPGKPVSMTFELDGRDSLDIPNEEWATIKGPSALAAHLAYLRKLAAGRTVVADADDN